MLNTISKKKEEIEDYSVLIKSLEEYEKATLMEYTDEDETKLIFMDSTNNEIKEKVEKLKEQLNNRYVDLYEWLEEEEIEIEAMLEALVGFDNMVATYEKLTQKSDTIDQDLKNIQFGQKGFTSFFKNKEKAQAELEASKKKTEEDIGTLHNIIKLSAFNMECFLEYFKNDKLSDYYKHLKVFSSLQKQNDQVLNELWDTVTQDKNMVENAPK